MQPITRIIPITTLPPSLHDNTGDIDRLKRGLAPLLQDRWPVITPQQMPAVARGFRQGNFRGFAVINDLPTGPALVDFFIAEPTMLPALALDLGTTHLEATLIDLLTGDTLTRGSCPNPQIEFGSDVLTRIHFATKDNGLEILQNQIITCINSLAAELAGKAAVPPEAIRALSVSGNTSMIHFLLGLSPYHLCREPYIPMANLPDPCLGRDLGLVIHPEAVVWILPSVGSYFGGDLISGILASGLDRNERSAMLIDVGTNAEVVVGNSEWLVACAGAAGPALEGGVARMGVQAGSGAIDHITINPATGAAACSTIGNSPPTGICGSGMIDLVAGLYLAGMIDARGKFRTEARQAGRHLVRHTDGLAYQVVPAAETAAGEPVLLTQVDLDALTRSKAAMYTILTTLVNQVGLSFSDLETIYVAGAFGRHIEPRQAITIGMLPDLPLQVYQPLGNSSLSGAESILIDGEARKRGQQVVKKITYIELNVNQEFMNRFSGAKFIPHTDRNLFPSVPCFQEL